MIQLLQCKSLLLQKMERPGDLLFFNDWLFLPSFVIIQRCLKDFAFLSRCGGILFFSSAMCVHKLNAKKALLRQSSCIMSSARDDGVFGRRHGESNDDDVYFYIYMYVQCRPTCRQSHCLYRQQLVVH